MVRDVGHVIIEEGDTLLIVDKYRLAIVEDSRLVETNVGDVAIVINVRSDAVDVRLDSGYTANHCPGYMFCKVIPYDANAPKDTRTWGKRRRV